jgi:zinc protease
VLDPPGAQGLAHLTAETLTRGTARRSASDLDRAIEFVGGSLEADAARDGVAVSLGVLRKDLDLGLDLLGEVLREPAFPEDEVRRTVGEIQASLRRAEENPETVAGREIAPLIFPGHPYARRPTGTVESVGRLTREQVVEFHRRHYRPEATVVVAVGDIRAGEFRRALLARLGSWAGQPGLPPVIPEAARTAAPGSRRLARPLTQATALLGRPAIRQADPDYFPLLVANYVLGGGSASRLYSRVREEQGLAYSVYSALTPGRHGASLVVGLQTRNDAVDRALALVESEMRRLGTDPVTPRELDLARAYLAGSFPLRMDTSSKLARLLVALEEHGLGLDYPDRFTQRVAQVTAADVQRVAARYLDPTAFSRVVVAGP